MRQPELGKKIAELRKAKGLTQEELVAECNLNVRTLQRIESGAVMPRSYTVRIIFAALDYNDSLKNIPNNISEIGQVFTNRLEQFYKYVIDLFNLKTNKMKKLSILATLCIFLVFSLFFINAKVLAQKYTIVIDAGHGGKDFGAQIKDKAIEKDIALSLAKLLKEKTKDNTDFKLIFTRDSDAFVRIDKRMNKANEVQADLFISIHINSNAKNELSGIECYTAKASDYKTKSEHIGRLFIDEFKQLEEIKTLDSIKHADFTVINYCQCPALLLNIGYLTNSNDLAYVSNKHNQRLICDKIIKAIAKIDK
jgi:N-acetylmuramoyl-L-alanine amidase